METAARTTIEPPAESGVRLREARTCHASIKLDLVTWRAELDGPQMGPMLLLYRQAPGGGWTFWGTAVWLGGRIQHPTARFVDPLVTEHLSAALSKALDACSVASS